MRRSIATTQEGSRQIRDLLQSVLIAEAIRPSERAWLVSAWITDALVIDNRGGELATLLPALPEREIRLSEALVELLVAGTRLVVVTNDHPANVAFVRTLAVAAAAADGRPPQHITATDGLVTDHQRGLHRKRLVTERFVIWGSMNFTYSGFERNAEDVSFETEPAAVAAAINEMEQLYPHERR